SSPQNGKKGVQPDTQGSRRSASPACSIAQRTAISYLISTFAPASSSFFLMESESALETASLTVEGTPSTRSFASFRPRPVISRITLITVTFLSAGYSLRRTVNSVFSSAGAAAAAPAPGAAATATGAAAVTPNFFSMSEMSSTTCIRVIWEIASRISSLLTAMLGLRKLFQDKSVQAAVCFWSRTAAKVRASLAGGSASVATNFWMGAFITPSSIDNACARVGRPATFSRSAPGSTCPPSATRVATSLSFAFAKSFTRRAAAPGSSFENASTSGPLSFGPTGSNEVPANALRASVFLTTRMYTPCARALERSSVICPTVSPRYSAATTDWALAATSATSATIAFLSSRLSAIPSLLSGEKIITKEAAGLPGGPRHGDLLASSRSLDAIAVHHLRRRSLRGTAPRLRSSMMAGPLTQPGPHQNLSCAARRTYGVRPERRTPYMYN